MKFNADGSLQTIEKKHADHLPVLQLIAELSFSIGKKLIAELLRGETNARIKKLGLDKAIYHGSLGGYDIEELTQFIDILIQDGLLKIELKSGRYPVVCLTKVGENELDLRSLTYKLETALSEKTILTTSSESYDLPPLQSAEITAQDRSIFSSFSFFLDSFTDEQKKAIICKDPVQVCIAGAGSGKTSVLTHKIAYLVKFAGVSPSSILAITFTRKAKEEMLSRLSSLLPQTTIRVETFNSYAEKELLKHGPKIYGLQKAMVSHRDFIQIVTLCLSQLGLDLTVFLHQYFLPNERRGKETRQLFFSFLYDFRTILDSYITHGSDSSYFEHRIQGAKLSEKVTANTLVKLCLLVHKELESRHLRTYGDQLVDVNTLYATHSSCIPSYDWVLVDEYQDVSPEQITLIAHLAPKHVFVVGDPRQSIYAWRGANPQTMFEIVYPDVFKDASIHAVLKGNIPTPLLLSANFRSTKAVVDFANYLISRSYGGKNVFTSMKSALTRQGGVTIDTFSSEEDELHHVMELILESPCPKNEIFILSRTNKGLEKYALYCKEHDIDFIMRTDEKKDLALLPNEQQITLSTVHASKGLEAELVFVIGASTSNYPCRAKDHRFVDLLASKEAYNVFEEERRLLYVACTRAKKELYISTTGSLTPFLSEKMKRDLPRANDSLASVGTHRPKSDPDRLARQLSALKKWRYLEASERKIPAYMVCSNATLDSILALQPLSLDDLYAIKGLGKAKIEEFGIDILHVLHKQ